MAAESPRRRDAARSATELRRALLRSWRRTPLRKGFTEGQVAGLIIVKLLYLRGSIPS